jgi:CHAT domain-containing protein
MAPAPGLPSGSAAAETRARLAGEALRRVVWDPLQEAVDGAARIFVVPDGSLHAVNIAALPAGDGGYVLESPPLFHLLPGELDLVPPTEPVAPGRGLLAVGGPDYGRFRMAAAGRKGEGASATRGRSPACTGGRPAAFAPLPDARREAREVAALWALRSGGGEDDRLLVGAEAGEAEVKRLVPGRRVVHLATHGFSGGDACDPEPPLLHRRFDFSGMPRGASGFRGTNPLLRSGLALAGANRIPGSPDDAGEDGILTAEEIASLDLTGVELAVLSACDTGLGAWQAGEGILGLQRALRTAGARSLVMSLWPADDAATRDWMRRFYESRLAGTSIPGAARDAASGMLRDRRAAGRSTHPFYWAGFVTVGDWR